MPRLQTPETSIDYKVRRSKRASRARIKIGIKTVEVVIPEKSGIQPEKLLTKNIDWVKRKRKEFEEYKEKIPKRKFEEGEKISFLGNKREIKIEKQNSHELTETSLIISERYIGEKEIRQKVREILRREAKKAIKEKVKDLSEKVNKVYIRDQKTKWGSCSSKNNLSFNWRICLGPEKVVDYIVAHEIAHLENKKHDEKFWNSVKEILPDYREGYEWLENNSHRLVFSREDYLDKR